MDKRFIIAGGILILILVSLTAAVIKIGSIQQKNFEILLSEIRDNAGQLQQIDKVFKKVGEDSSEVRDALLMDPVEYSTTPSIRTDADTGDRYDMFIEAFKTFGEYYADTEYSKQLTALLDDNRFKQFIGSNNLAVERNGTSFVLSGETGGSGPLSICSGEYGPGGLTLRAGLTGETKSDAGDIAGIVDFISLQIESVENAYVMYNRFVTDFAEWNSRIDTMTLLDDYKIVFEPGTDALFERVLKLRTSDYRPIGELRVTREGDFVFFGHSFDSFRGFTESFPELLKQIDTRSYGTIKTEENVTAIKATVSDPEFQSILEAYGLSIEKSTREDADFFYFDISKDGHPYGSFGVLKEHGDLYILDTDDVPITSLESLDVQRLLDGGKEESGDVGRLGTSDDLRTVLLCGSHEKNPDTMILFVSSKKSGKGYLFSLPRDLYYKGQKINNIYRHFGPDQLLKDLSGITGLEINKYVNIDMYAFIDVINILGGIDIILDEPLIDPSYRIKEKGVWKTLHYAKGPHHLDGLGALRVARSRHTSSDFERSERQQLIIASLMDKMNGMPDVTTMYKLVNSAFRYVSTNLSPVDAVQLAVGMKDLDIAGKYVLNTKNVLYHTTSPAGLWILLPKDDNWNSIATYIQSKLQF